MNENINLIESAMNGNVHPYNHVLHSLIQISNNFYDPESERLLFKLIRFEGRMNFPKELNYELPSSLPPEQMLSSVALQTLVKWAKSNPVKAKEYLEFMERFEITAEIMLKSITKWCIKEMRDL